MWPYVMNDRSHCNPSHQFPQCATESRSVPDVVKKLYLTKHICERMSNGTPRE